LTQSNPSEMSMKNEALVLKAAQAVLAVAAAAVSIAVVQFALVVG